ncbi:MAG: serine hydrolase [Saprospiraceae bacterium]
MKSFVYLVLLFSFAWTSNAQTGIAVPQMSHCDNLFTNFMNTHNIPSATVAIAKDGKMVYNRAFGHADVDGTEPTLPHHLFRIASLSKPITSIAIMKMVENNQLSLTDKVFGSGGLLENHSGLAEAQITDTRIFNITVQQLLEHSGGWDRNVNCFPNPTSPYSWNFGGCDPIVAPLHVTQTNGTNNLATEEDMIIFLLEKGLNFNPGSRYAYSNIGYLVLGEIIEEVSGQSYEDYVKSEILSPIGICDMHIGKNLLADKLEREGEYVGNGFTTLSAYNTGDFVPWEYGGFNLEAMDAHGGWIATARDLVQLLVSVDGFATKPDILSSASIATMTTAPSISPWYAKGWQVNSADNWWHTGALDGTATIFVRSSGGFTWAVLLNKRVIGNTEGQFWGDFDNLPWNCVLQTTNFPNHDLLAAPKTNAHDIHFVRFNENSVDLSWTNGNGNLRILVAKEGETITDFPLDGNSYVADSNFGLGSDLGNNTFVVFKGTDNDATVSNLTEDKTYHFRVFDYKISNTNGNHEIYKLCGGEEVKILMNVLTSTDELTDAEVNENIAVYPTIVQDLLHVNFTEKNNLAQYELYSINGKFIEAGNLPGLTNEINVANLERGLFILKIRQSDNERVIWKRFVKQ